MNIQHDTVDHVLLHGFKIERWFSFDFSFLTKKTGRLRLQHNKQKVSLFYFLFVLSNKSKAK